MFLCIAYVMYVYFRASVCRAVRPAAQPAEAAAGQDPEGAKGVPRKGV